MKDIKVLIIGKGHKPVKIAYEYGETDLNKENPMTNIEDLVNQVNPYNSAYKCKDYNGFSVLCLSCNYPDEIKCSKETDRKRVFDYFDEIIKKIDNITDEEFDELITNAGFRKEYDCDFKETVDNEDRNDL